MSRSLRLALLGGLFAASALLMACSSSGSSNGGTPAAATITADGTAVVNVTLAEWSLKVGNAVVPAGKVSFHVRNAGTVPHDVVVIRTDLAADRLPVKGNAVNTSSLDVVDTLTQFDAGKTSDLAVTLTPGHYVLICNLPGHYQLGMRTDLTVQ